METAKPSSPYIMENPFADIDLESSFDGRRACDWCMTMTLPHGLVPPHETGRPGLIVCSHCWSRRKELALRKSAAEQVKAGLVQIVRAAKADHLASSPIQRVFQELFDLFPNDVAGFCRSWKTSLDAAIQKDPGSKTVLDTHYAMYKVAVSAAADRNEITRDYSNLSLEQIQGMVGEFLDQRPEVIEAARLLSYDEQITDAECSEH